MEGRLSSRQRYRNCAGSNNNNSGRGWMKKYVIACLVCGGLSIAHGIVFVIIYLLLRSYTSSLQFFETIPTYVPGIVFIITGLILTCFIKRRNRYAFLIKMAGGCCLVCALLCVVITVTTTVVHMNRLQTLHECVYTPQSKTCMCISAVGDHDNQETHRFVFNSTPNCEVVHGSLYSCLRVLFSFSVLGILLCISCSMLLYQLLNHEKKRLYWEQLELRRRFLYQRHSHHSVCGCYDELYPWHIWDMIDYRLLASHNNMASIGNEEEQCSPTNSAFRDQASRSGNRPSGWNWLPWQRQMTERTQNEIEDTPTQANFMQRLMSRESWNQHHTSASNEDVDSLPWRSECIHIFRSRNTSCFPPSSHFGIRSRNSPYGRPQVSHRRTRSNDGIFHHLHLNSSPRYAQPYSLVDPCNFSGYEVPRYMWGPPPPYSQPRSAENIVLYDENQCRRSGIEQLRSISHCDPVLTGLELEQVGNGSMSSKMSTPLSERRFVCHNFTSDGITLTIGGNYTNMCSQNTVPREHKNEETCIVEVHVPYLLQKKDVFFNTLPARNCKKKNINPFKSLSNIPLGLSRKINVQKSEKSDPGQLSVIKAACDLQENTVSLYQGTNVNSVETCINRSSGLRSLSTQLFCDEPILNNMTVDMDATPSSVSYQPTLVEVPSDLKSGLVIATSPSTPVTENVTLTNKIYAQSMPNLNMSNSSLPCHIPRAPSSGNTSTSQDFADFEDDSSPIILCSPVSSLPPLPDDDATDSSSSYPPCLFRCDAAFSNESSSAGNSDSSSCGVIVIGNIPESKLVAPSIIISKRPPTECPISCNIRHLHRYHPDGGDQKFVVTIKSVNV
ncbi:uncharacterized protein [Parasteatoda tepidariorum]|uniref:uncharacterized protein isoform X2 n=1 Tax=Parasteatoda tepidariorum TaxID=114398 RepID=UPI00077FABAD|nr:uncharacterized protein LOC107455730 isoform X2 [Parasteatoda tepidariorum]XP_015928887.1 uncharacterized protein LOC107455730 isoform X2 [Parasteatoda tepidariorum]XP_015928889.1 uncharacterized protein LOC107455730 isoform X2 [Parasteatoda tepidariorum]